MTKVVFFLIILFFALLGYIAILNQDNVSIKLGEKYIYEIPQIALILLSWVIGAVSILSFVAVRDARRYLESLQNQRQQKKDSKLRELYSKGLDAYYANRYDEAQDLFDRIVKEDKTNSDVLLRRGDIAFKTGDLAKAKNFYMKAKDMRPHSVEALLSLENVFESENNWQGALRYLDNILEIDEENPGALYKKRHIYEISENWDALLDTQSRILKLDMPEAKKQDENKRLSGYKYELGRHCLEQGDIERAVKTLKALIKQDKDFVAAYLALAESYIRNGDSEEAERLLIEGYETTSALVFLVRLEDFFIAVGEPGRIIDIYQKAVQGSPGDQNLQFFLAKLYFRLEMIDYAYETATGIDTVTSDYPDIHILLGGIYERRSEHDKAAEEFKKALNFRRPILVPYCCTGCGFISKEWMGRCPECKNWNGFTLKLSGTCKV
jgi:tetratricopeptide (TPR) repeat protein